MMVVMMMVFMWLLMVVVAAIRKFPRIRVFLAVDTHVVEGSGM